MSCKREVPLGLILCGGYGPQSQILCAWHTPGGHEWVCAHAQLGLTAPLLAGPRALLALPQPLRPSPQPTGCLLPVEKKLRAAEAPLQGFWIS